MAGQPTLPENSQLYVDASNDTGTQRTFDERQRYNFVSYPALGSRTYFNFWGQDKYYARLDSYGSALTVNESRLGQLRYAQGGIFVLDFVAHAFRDYAEKMRTLASSGKIYKDSPYANPEAFRGWTSVPVAYEEYLSATVFPALLNYITPPMEREIRNFASFLKVFGDFASTVIGSSGPMTLAGFIESVFSSPQNTGLVIEIADEDHSADQQKVKKYLMDKNYEIASNIASQYGFSFDKNAPWRLVANLGSPAMQEYIFGIFLQPEYQDSRNSTDDCGDVIPKSPRSPEDPWGYSGIPGFRSVRRHAPGFDFYRNALGVGVGGGIAEDLLYPQICATAYEQAWASDMDLLKINLLRFYNSYVKKTPVTALPPNGTTRCETASLRRLPAPLVTIDGDVGVYRDKWNLQAYYNFRALERGTQLPPSVAAQDIQSAINIYNYSSGDPDYRYLRALRKVQEQVGTNGSLGSVPYNYITLGDMMGY